MGKSSNVMPNENSAKNRIHLLILDTAVKNQNPELVTEITIKIKEDLGITAHRLTKILDNNTEIKADEAMNITTILNEYLPEEERLTMDDLFEKSQKAA
jgi:hypothetical protein